MSDSSLGDLERRVTELENRIGQVPIARSPQPTAELLNAEFPTDAVRYDGAVNLAGPVRWRIQYAAESAVALPTDTVSTVFAALGHPARLDIVRLLLRGNASVTDLQEAGDFRTTGQLYHHLAILTNAAVVVKLGRNEYGIAATHVVPTLVAIVAAGDIGGAL